MEREGEWMVRPRSVCKLAHPYHRRKFFLPVRKNYRSGGLIHLPFAGPVEWSASLSQSCLNQQLAG
jgi:hypothetical protein